MKRRNFLDRAVRLATASGAYGALSQLQLISSATAASSIVDDDYKALICLFLPGGIDSFNVLIPDSGHEERTNYEISREAIAISSPDLLSLSGTEKFGVHPKLSSVPSLYENSKLAFLTNVGSLVQPVPNVADALQALSGQGGLALPPSIGSHNDQQNLWQTLNFTGGDPVSYTHLTLPTKA